METMRESWTDERLDYLSNRVDEGFKRVDDGFNRVDEKFERVDEKFDRMNDRLLDLHRLIVQGGIAMFSTMLVGFLTVLATTL